MVILYYCKDCAKFLKARGTIIPNSQFLLEIVTVPPIGYSKVKPHIISFGCGVLIYGYAGEFALDTSRKVEEPVVKVNLFHILHDFKFSVLCLTVGVLVLVPVLKLVPILVSEVLRDLVTLKPQEIVDVGVGRVG